MKNNIKVIHEDLGCGTKTFLLLNPEFIESCHNLLGGGIIPIEESMCLTESRPEKFIPVEFS